VQTAEQTEVRHVSLPRVLQNIFELLEFCFLFKGNKQEENSTQNENKNVAISFDKMNLSQTTVVSIHDAPSAVRFLNCGFVPVSLGGMTESETQPSRT
jgi:hypothetical protein